VGESGGFWKGLLMVDDDGQVYWKGILIVYVIPMITITVICLIKCKETREKEEEGKEE
jgi:hypothetical protein